MKPFDYQRIFNLYMDGSLRWTSKTGSLCFYIQVLFCVCFIIFWTLLRLQVVILSVKRRQVCYLLISHCLSLFDGCICCLMTITLRVFMVQIVFFDLCFLMCNILRYIYFKILSVLLDIIVIVFSPTNLTLPTDLHPCSLKDPTSSVRHGTNSQPMYPYL